MLTCAEQLLAQLPGDVELWLVGTGAEEVGCRGMHAFVSAHSDWPKDSTFFVNFECVGGGSLHWVRSEGTLAKTGFPPTLVELARRVAASGVFGELTPVDLLAGTDGHVPADRGYPVALADLARAQRRAPQLSPRRRRARSGGSSHRDPRGGFRRRGRPRRAARRSGSDRDPLTACGSSAKARRFSAA